MMTVEDKVEKLGIKPIDDAFYLEHLKDADLLGHDVRRFKYFKMYGNTPMMYTEGYLQDNALEDLKRKDKLNIKRFCPSILGRIKNKIELFKLRLFLF